MYALFLGSQKKKKKKAAIYLPTVLFSITFWVLSLQHSQSFVYAFRLQYEVCAEA